MGQDEEAEKLTQQLKETLVKEGYEITAGKFDIEEMGDEGYATVMFMSVQSVDDATLLALSEKFPDFDIQYLSIEENSNHIKDVTYSEGEIQSDYVQNRFEWLNKEYDKLISYANEMEQQNDYQQKESSIDESFESKIEPFDWMDHGDFFGLYHRIDGFRDEIFNSKPNDRDFKIKGNGYDWEFLAKEFLDEHMPELKDGVRFDSEAGMFCAYIENIETLQKFGLEFRKTFDDEKKVQDMTEKYEKKDDIILAQNWKKIKGIIDEFKENVQDHPDLILHESVKDVDVYKFVGNDVARIEIDQKFGVLSCFTSTRNISDHSDWIQKHIASIPEICISVDYDDFDWQAEKFDKFYKAEIEKALETQEQSSDHFIEVSSNDEYVSVDSLSSEDDVVQKQHEQSDMEL